MIVFHNGDIEKRLAAQMQSNKLTVEFEHINLEIAKVASSQPIPCYNPISHMSQPRASPEPSVPARHGAVVGGLKVTRSCTVFWANRCCVKRYTSLCNTSPQYTPQN